MSPQPYQALTIRVKNGSRLMSRTSSEEAGLQNYVTKRNWRRDLDQDIRSEGHDYFWPNITGDFAADPLNQPFPFNITARTPTSITRSTVTATVTIAAGHDFVNGETVKVSGANQSPYNISAVIFGVTRTTFQYTMASDPGASATGTLSVRSDMPINLVTMARRPNGKTAVVVGTPTRLFRFFAMDNGAYFEGTGADAYYEEPPAANSPYYDNNPGNWIQIGSGFSPYACRWEWASNNGYLILNNGWDLPVTYRVEEYSVVPIYELREQGVASVGSIAEIAGILMAGDISFIQTAALTTIMAPSGDVDSGNLFGVQAATVVTVPSDFFTAAMVGHTIVWARGIFIGKITVFTNARQVTVDTNQAVNNVPFILRNRASQAGAQYSGTILASVAASGTTVTASAPIFSAPMVGKTIRFLDGFSAVISAFTDNTHVTIAGAGPTAAIVSLPFWISEASSYTVVAHGKASFTSEMIGKRLIWDDGNVRTITAWTDEFTVTVDTDAPITLGYFRFENALAYAAFTSGDKIDRIQYRVIWGMIDEPRRWGAIVKGTIPAGSNLLTLQWPARSFEYGQEIIIEGAGVNGGNLTAMVISVSALGNVLALSETATTLVTLGPVSRSDVPDSVVGFEDLQGDGSGILRMLGLSGALIIYKDTSIFMAQYTGDVAKPFDFIELEIPKTMSLFYRWTAISVGGQYHIYAGRNAFYRFDLTSRVPQLITDFEVCSDIFFSQATLAQMELIYSADNSLTSEIWIQFPSATSDKGMRFDYKFGTIATTDLAVSAAGTVKRPATGNSTGAIDHWFVMGTSAGVVLVYGKTDQPQPQPGWANGNAIFYRRSAYPFSATKVAYTSTLKAGMGDFGDMYNEKNLRAYVLYLSSQSPNCVIAMNLYGVRNTAETPVLLLAYSLASPKTTNLIPVTYSQMYYQDELIIAGVDNPCRISARTFDPSLDDSQSHLRRP